MNEVKERLKGFFNAGDKPTEAQFAELIDRGLYPDENGNLVIADGKVGIGTESPPSEKLEVNGKIKTHGIALSQDIRHNGVPVMGFLESPSSDPATPIRAKKLTGTFVDGERFLQIPHGISSSHVEKIAGLIPHTLFGNPIFDSSTSSAFTIKRVVVTSTHINLEREIDIGDVPTIVFLLYLDL